MKKIFLVIAIVIPVLIHAAPFNGKIMSFKQPDGSTVDVKLFGNEFYMRAEGLDGYTLVRDKNTHWICYAELSPDNNELVSSGIIYHGNRNNFSASGLILPFPKHLDVIEKSRERVNENKTIQLGLNKQNENLKTAWHPVSGNIKGLCIVVDFSDEPGSLSMSEFNDFCNNLTYNNFGNNGSLRTFYSDVSGGLVDYQNVVYGYYRAPYTFAVYDAMPYAQGAQEILGLALNWIESTGFDFSTLTINTDGSIMAINLMYTGYAQNWAEGMWWHQGYYPYFSADGVHSGDYNCSPAFYPLSLATVCHENGHMIGKWPDTYKYNTTTGPDGIGSFDLMCYYGDEFNPVPPNPHFRNNAGWGKMVDITYYNGINKDTCNNLTCYKYINPNDTNEFFLLENMRSVGRYEYIPDEGLTIWHIDRNGDNQTTHHEVYLVHANNDITYQYNACFHSGFNAEFSHSTTPNSDYFNTDPSGLRVWNIGGLNNIMTYNLGTGTSAPIFSLSYVNLTNDDNSNGFLEPGESGDVNIAASNFGQVNSGASTVTCTAIGANSGYVTINTPSVNAGIINVSQTFTSVHNVSLSSAIPLGSVITLKFEISDGIYSTYITKQIIAGNLIVMNNQQVTTCSAVFYDQGGIFANYSNMTDYTTTIYPLTPSQKIQVNFSFLDVEDYVNCGFDYLSIYNGSSISSSLIGKFCGTTSPGIITSTDATGALTFRFHSDEGVTGAGWAAIVSCTGSTMADNSDEEIQFEIFPNPSSGKFYLNPKNSCSEITVYNVTGKIVFNTNISGIQDPFIDISAQPEGLYLLRVKSDSYIYSKTLIIQK